MKVLGLRNVSTLELHVRLKSCEHRIETYDNFHKQMAVDEKERILNELTRRIKEEKAILEDK